MSYAVTTIKRVSSFTGSKPKSFSPRAKCRFSADPEAQPRSQGLSSNRPLGRARRDPGLVWSRATLTIENIREGSSVIRQFVALSFVALRLTFISNSIYSGVYLKGLASLSRDNLPWS